jgi:hypothetical protein
MKNNANDGSSSSSLSEEKAAKKLQAFVRGAVCRAKVSETVKKLIEELLAARGLLSAEESVTTDDMINQLPNEGDSINGELVGDESHRSMDLNGGGPSNSATAGDGYHEEEGGDLHKSVSDIRSKLESKRDPNSTPPKRNWSPKKASKETLVGSAPTAPDLDFGPRRTLKDTKLQQNSTKHVLSSDDLLSQHGVSYKIIIIVFLSLLLENVVSEFLITLFLILFLTPTYRLIESSTLEINYL